MKIFFAKKTFSKQVLLQWWVNLQQQYILGVKILVGHGEMKDILQCIFDPPTEIRVHTTTRFVAATISSTNFLLTKSEMRSS
jgi:hypothetical protein